MLKVFAFFCLLHSGVYSGAQQYIRTELSAVNGLGQGDVDHFSQDSLGYIWITQKHGVTRFNGREFVQFEANPADSNLLPTTEVYHITHLPDGNAWFSHVGGLSFYNRKENRFTTYDRQDGLHCDIVSKTFADGDSILYAAHWYGYDRINLKTFSCEWLRPFPEIQDSLFRHRSFNLTNHPKQNPYNTNQLFSIHRNDLYVLDKTTLLFTKLTDFKVGENAALKDAFYLIEYEWADANNILINFFPNEGEVFMFNLQTKVLTPVKLIANKSLWVSEIQKTGDNTFLCLEQSLGAFHLDIDKNKIEIIDPNLHHRTYVRSFVDRDGAIWVGEHGYAYRYEPTQNITFTFGVEEYILSHVADPETGTIITFSYINSKILHFENGGFREIAYPPLKGLSTTTFYHPFQKSFFNLTGNYLHIFHPLSGVFKKIKLDALDRAEQAYDVTPMPDGFYASINTELYHVDLNGKVLLQFSADQRIGNIAYHQDKIFYSTPGRVHVYNLKSNTHQEIISLDEFTIIPLLIHENILIILWRSKLKYIKLSEPGYTVLDSDLDQKYPDTYFLQIRPSGEDLLVTAEFKMIRLNGQTLQPEKMYSYLDQIDIGYWDDHFSTKDDYYITTDSKKIIAFPKNLKTSAFLSYQIEEVEINGQKRIFNQSPFRLRYDENNIDIKSDAVYTGVFDKLTYYYRNTANEEDWIKMKSDALQLFDQRPGKYSIDFKVIDRYDQEWVLTKAVVFEISPPWYQSKWFYFGIALSCLALFYGIYQYRLKQIRKNYDFQSKLQQLEMSALKAQMNPHFIFNCLNSIKGLILIGESEKAVNYIGTFSKLVRSSLDSAEEKMIPLKEELDIAENYLSLERLRYGPKLTWSIRFQDESLLSEIKLPPFILQPLLENAILHGIKYVKHDGFIHILGYRENSNVHIKIIDNGIGLRSSQSREESNEHSTRKHLGVSLVERRLKIISATLSIYDHMDASGNTAGTISEIIIPQPHE